MIYFLYRFSGWGPAGEQGTEVEHHPAGEIVAQRREAKMCVEPRGFGVESVGDE